MRNELPRYSQYLDVSLFGWKNYACGAVSLRIIVDFYFPKFKKISLNTTIKQGLVLQAYIPGVGWAYKGLIRTARLYGCKGIFFDWREEKIEVAYKKMLRYLADGPIMVSIPKDFNLKSSSHLVVLETINEKGVYIIDPASHERKNISYSVPTETFIKHWKKRILVIRPNIAKRKK